MIVVDSSVWIDHFNGRPTPQVQVLAQVLDDQSFAIVVGDIIMYEVLAGFRSPSAALVARAWLEELLLASMLGFELVHSAVGNYRALRARGVTIKAADVFIGTYCVTNGLELLTSDRDFLAMHDHLGLRLLSPPAR